jgi:hypothetical protein
LLLLLSTRLTSCLLPRREVVASGLLLLLLLLLVLPLPQTPTTAAPSTTATPSTPATSISMSWSCHQPRGSAPIPTPHLIEGTEEVQPSPWGQLLHP